MGFGKLEYGIFKHGTDDLKNHFIKWHYVDRDSSKIEPSSRKFCEVKQFHEIVPRKYHI